VDPAETTDAFGGGESFTTPAREVNAFRSGFFDRLEDGLRAAPCHGISELEGTTLLWLEDLSEARPHPWGRDEFITASREIGRFNGGWPAGRAPRDDWFDRELKTNRPLAGIRSGWLDKLQDPGSSPEVVELAARLGPDRMPRMNGEYAGIVRSMVGLPRVVCHNDSHSRNLFIRDEGESTPVVYAVDWAAVGLGPVGIDGGTLAGGGLIWAEEEARLIADIEADMFDAYLAGLSDAGYEFDRDEVRLGYLSNLLPYIHMYVMGVVLLPEGGWTIESHSRRFGVEPAGLLEQYFLRLQLFMPMYDEAVTLAGRPG
jgi:hypothetical protein